METKKLLAIFLPILAIMVFTITNSIITKKEMTIRERRITFAVASTGIVVLLVLVFIVI